MVIIPYAFIETTNAFFTFLVQILLRRNMSSAFVSMNGYRKSDVGEKRTYCKCYDQDYEHNKNIGHCK